MKIVNTFLSILVFFLTFIFLYQIIYFGYIDSNKVESYVDNIKLTDKVNLEIKKDNYFISNVNRTYKDLLSMKYKYKDIKNIEKDSNINLVLSSIMINKITNLKEGTTPDNTYTKNKLDQTLLNNKFSDELKLYIISNDYKIIEFENRINSKVKIINNVFKPFRFIFNKLSVIISLVLVLLISILFIINKKYSNIFIPLLITNFLNIIISIIILALLNTKYKYTIINYFFYNFILNILKKSVILSVVIIFFAIILITIISINNKKKIKKIKPRIRKEIKDEEDFGFGL